MRWAQFVAMMFARLSSRSSLRDITDQMKAHSSAEAKREIDKFIRYLSENKSRIDYGAARRGGYHIGSGRHREFEQVHRPCPFEAFWCLVVPNPRQQYHEASMRQVQWNLRSSNRTLPDQIAGKGPNCQTR